MRSVRISSSTAVCVIVPSPYLQWSCSCFIRVWPWWSSAVTDIGFQMSCLCHCFLVLSPLRSLRYLSVYICAFPADGKRHLGNCLANTVLCTRPASVPSSFRLQAVENCSLNISVKGKKIFEVNDSIIHSWEVLNSLSLSADPSHLQRTVSGSGEASLWKTSLPSEREIKGYIFVMVHFISHLGDSAAMSSALAGWELLLLYWCWHLSFPLG